MCQLCCAAPTEEVHHVVAVRDDESLRLVRSNLLALCGRCHRRVTRREVAARRRRSKVAAG